MLRRLVLFLALAAGCVARGQLIPAIVDVQSYWSPSGRFRLEVMPGDKSGVGAATYTLSKGGKVIWSGRKQYTLMDAVVTENGTSFGYTYTAGIDSLEPGARDDVDIWRLSPNGVDKRIEFMDRHTSGTDLPNEPYVDGLFLKGDTAVLVSIEHVDPVIRQQRAYVPTVRTYSVSAGKLNIVFDAATSFGPNQVRPELQGMTSVTGEPLLVTSWSSIRAAENSGVVRLIDLSGRAIWSRNGRVEIVKDSQPSHFTLHSGPVEIHFAVRRLAHGYAVREVGRSPFVPKKPAVEPAPPAFANLPLVQTVDLGSAHAFSEVAIGPNRIITVDDGHTARALDFSGRQLWKVSLSAANLAPRLPPPVIAGLDPDGSAWIRTDSGELQMSSAGVQIGALPGKSYPLIPVGSISSYAGPGLRYQVAEGYQEVIKVTMAAKIVKIVARNDRHWLGDILQIDSAPDGSFAALSTVGGHEAPGPNTVSVFSSSGGCLNSFTLPKWLDSAFGLQFDGTRILVENAKAWTCFSRTGKPLWRFKPPRESARSRGQAPVLIDSANELAAFDLDHTVRIYKLP